jgi:hypothetical protein
MGRRLLDNDGAAAAEPEHETNSCAEMGPLEATHQHYHRRTTASQAGNRRRRMRIQESKRKGTGDDDDV